MGVNLWNELNDKTFEVDTDEKLKIKLSELGY